MNPTADLLSWQPPARSRKHDPETSKLAAESLSSTHLEELERRIVGYLREQGNRGATCHEISEALDVEYGSITPRMVFIERKGLIIRTCERRKSEGRRIGSLVWVFAPQAIAVAA